MIADFVCWVCGDASQVIGEVARCQAVQRSERQGRQLELNALGHTQPVQTGKCVCDVIRAPKSCDRTSCSVYVMIIATIMNFSYLPAID